MQNSRKVPVFIKERRGVLSLELTIALPILLLVLLAVVAVLRNSR